MTSLAAGRSAPGVLIPPTPHTSRGYWPALDGIRALAVAEVILLHAGSRFGRKGDLGVDAFFVLSGFLITTILLAERERTGGLNLPAFYLRRAFRLFPALILVVVATAGISVLLVPALRDPTLQAIPYAATYSFNWLMALGSPRSGLLSHTWSLAIEEQFYLLWPPIILGLSRLGLGIRGIGIVAVSLGLASAVWRAVLLQLNIGSPTVVQRVYFGSDTEAFEILFGCAAAAAYLSAPAWSALAQRWLKGVAAAVVVALAVIIVLPLNVYSDVIRYGLPLVCAGIAVIILDLVVAPLRWLEWPLSRPPLVLLGRVSYGVYLWQWPVILLVTVTAPRVPPVGLVLIVVPVSIAVAAGSYLLVERRFLLLRKR
ncbi:MAG: acyltransferase family protein [Candidatus Dormibacteria bacterium]